MVFKNAAVSAIAGNVFLRQGSAEIATSESTYLRKIFSCAFEVETVIAALGKLFLICLKTRCSIDSCLVPCSKIFINCFARISFDNGNNLLPLPPESKTICIKMTS